MRLRCAAPIQSVVAEYSICWADQYGFCSWNCQAIDRPETARMHFQCQPCHKSIFGFVPLAVVGSFSGVGRHPACFWLIDNRESDTVTHEKWRVHPIHSFSASMLPPKLKRNFWTWDNPISKGAISWPNCVNSTVSLSFTMSSSLLRALQRCCDIRVSRFDHSLIRSRLYRLRPRKPLSCSSPTSRCRNSQEANWRIRCGSTAQIARCYFSRRKA